jgi:predicted metal-dependent enzyme (double-stranded beta helix superfamily)
MNVHAVPSGGAMFDVDALLADCQDAIDANDPVLAVRDVLERAVADPAAIASALPPERAELVPLHVSDRLTVLKIVWAPGMVLGPHDHRMWAAIALYTGGEDNRFFRRTGSTLVDSGARSLRPRDVCLLGDDTVHSVANPTGECAGAIHVYGGDFFATPRSEWRGEPPTESPFDVDRLLVSFAAANEVLDREA